jgi:hypothetical protein
VLFQIMAGQGCMKNAIELFSYQPGAGMPEPEATTGIFWPEKAERAEEPIREMCPTPGFRVPGRKKESPGFGPGYKS